MIYEYRIGEKSIPVELEREGDGYKASCNGETYRVIAQRILPGTLSLLIGGRSVLAHAAKGDGVWHISVGGRAYELRLPGAAESEGGGGGDVPELVDGVLQTPMPGRVVSVTIEPGKEVKAGEPICVLESMKMENAVNAPKDGKIAEVFVSVGDNPNTGQPIASYE